MLDFQNANDLERARAAAAHQLQEWQRKIGMSIKRAADIHEAGIYAQVRPPVLNEEWS
jgi:hypothetical protein